MNTLPVITVTEEADGTFYVRRNGDPHLRLRTLALAERQAVAMRRYAVLEACPGAAWIEFQQLVADCRRKAATHPEWKP